MKPYEAVNAAKRIRSSGNEWAERIDALILPQCHPWQRNAVVDPSRRITLLCGRGAGKTSSMMLRALRKLVRIPSGRIVYCASSRPMAEELMWAPFKDKCERLGLETGKDIEFHETKLRATFLRTGATLRLVGVDDKKEIDKLRGQPFDEVLLDEASIYAPELLDNLVFRVIVPRLGDRLGTLLLGGTPGHIMRGLFYDTTRPGSNLHTPYAPERHEGWTGWSSHAWELGDIVQLPDAPRKYAALVNLFNDHLAEKEANKWSDDNPIWQREFKGKWASDNAENVYKYRPHVDGKPWNEWGPLGGEKGGTLLHLKAAVAALPRQFTDWRYVVGADEGSSDPFACNIFAFAPADQTRTIWHVFSFEQTKMYAKPIAELLLGPEAVARALAGKAPEPYDGLLSVTGYPDAAVMDGNQPTIDELKNVYGIQFVRFDRRKDYKFGAIELVNGDLIDGRLKILKGSPLAQQLGELQWQADQFGNLQENKSQANHSTDCLVIARKAIATMFEQGTVEQPTAAAKPKPDPELPEREPRGEFDAMVGGDDFGGMFDDGAGNYY